MKLRLAIFKDHVLPALVCFGVALALAQMEWLQRFENITLDARARLRTRFFPTNPRDDVVLIGIDEASLNNKAFGRWPWDRSLHGDFVQLCGFVKPSVIAWDILFDDPHEEDGRFANGIRRGKTDVVLGGQSAEADIGLKPDDASLKKFPIAPLSRIEGDRSAVAGDDAMSVPRAPLGEVADIGFVNAPPGPDGVLREAPLIVRIGDRIYPTLSLRSLMHHWHLTSDQVLVRLGDAVVIENDFMRRRIPIDRAGNFLINYRHTLGGFRNYGYAEAFTLLKQRFVDKRPVDETPELTGRILLIGQTADGLTDFGPTPLSSHTPLVLVHANVLENVLNDDFARRARNAPIWVVGFAITAASLAFLTKRKFYQQALFSLGVPVAYSLAAILCWAKFSVWVPVVWPVLGFGSAQIFMVGRRVLAEQRAKEQIKGMFGTYVSPELVSRMVASGESPRLGGHEADITAFFSDIQAYSTFSEKLPPEQLVELLNEYLTACTDIVQEEGGTLDKYIGDAIVAMFGAPIALPDHAARACLATLRVQGRLAELRAKWEGEGGRWPEAVRKMRSRVGLNSGPAIIGNMGSRTRFNYTMTGDNVNLAARMESGAKSWGVYSMCTESTRLACERHAPGRVVFRPLGRIVVKGRTQAVPIHELVGLTAEVAASVHEGLGLFAEALASYYARDWDGARARFERSQLLESNIPGRAAGVATNPSLVYLGLVEHFRREPPPENWNGEYVMTEK